MDVSEETAHCAPLAIPANRLDLELTDINKWPEAIKLRRHAQLLMLAVPRPPADEGVLLALESVEDFRLQLANTAEAMVTPRPLKVATTAATVILRKVSKEAGLAGIPAAAKTFRADGCATSGAMLAQVTDTLADNDAVSLGFN